MLFYGNKIMKMIKELIHVQIYQKSIPKVALNGWISKSRDLGGLMFIDLKDRYGITQIVFNENKQRNF